MLVSANADIVAGGNVSVLAAQTIVQNANITASGAATTIELIAGGAISMGATATISTNNGNVVLNAAGGNVTLETINAGTANVAVTASGNILDGHTTAVEDITAAGLILKAAGGIGTDGTTPNALETSVSTLSLSAGTAGAYVTESNAVTVNTLTVAVNRVGSDASVPATASGTATLTQEDLSSAGKLVLISTLGDITVNAGTPASGAVQAAGNMLIQATAGAITLNANAANSAGNTSLSAAGNIVQNANITASGAAATIELVAGGAISMGATATISTNNGNVVLNAAGGVALGQVTAGTAAVALIAGSGSITDANSSTNNVAAGSLMLRAGLSAGVPGDALETAVDTLAATTAGNGIYLAERDAVAVNTVTVSVARVDVLATTALQTLTLSDLATTGGNGNIELIAQGSISLKDGSPINAISVSANGSGNITIQAQAAGSDVFVDAKVLSVSGVITIQGANTVRVVPGVEVSSSQPVNLLGDTTLTAQNTSNPGNLVVTSPNLKIVEPTVFTSNNTAIDGVLLVTGSVSGNNGNNETLTLDSKSNVKVTGSISNIDALTVNAAHNVSFTNTVAITGAVDVKASGDVSFEQGLTLTQGASLTLGGSTAGTSAHDVTFGHPVKVNGNVVIKATGVVEFKNTLNLTNGGMLDIQGATKVVFADGSTITVDGDLRIDAKAMSLPKGGSLNSSKPGSTLTITSAGQDDATGNNDVMVGGFNANMLSLTIDDIQAIGNNFSQVVIGQKDLGNIIFAGNTDLTSIVTTTGNSTVGAGITVLGNTITLQPGTQGGAVLVPGDVSLKAKGEVKLDSGISTAGTNKISVTSNGGMIKMAESTRLDSLGGNIELLGNGMALGYIDARSADRTVIGLVNIDAGNSTVTDANRNSAPDIYAKAINFTGYGPATGTAGDVIEVVADVVQISVPKGLVVRDTAADGRTYFNVMDAGNLYRQLVVEGTNVTRVTQDPAALLGKSDTDLIAAGIPRNSPLLKAPVMVTTLAAAFASTQSQPIQVTSMAVSRYLGSPVVEDALNGTIKLNTVALNTGLTEDLLSDQSYGIASRLQQSYILGTPGEQPFVTGLDTFSQDAFEYWVDTLSL